MWISFILFGFWFQLKLEHVIRTFGFFHLSNLKPFHPVLSYSGEDYLLYCAFKYNKDLPSLTSCVTKVQPTSYNNNQHPPLRYSFRLGTTREGAAGRANGHSTERWSLPWLRVYVTVKRHSLIHKQHATNRAAILYENHWGARWGGGGCGAQRTARLTAATFPSLFWFDNSEANENQAHQAPGYQGRNVFLDLTLVLWSPTSNLNKEAHKGRNFAK